MNCEYENIPDFKELPEKLYQTAHDNAWSKENMAGHDAEGRTLEYMGGVITKNDDVFNYYLDDQGDWWYKTLAAVPDKGIVPIEDKIFPPETRKTDLQGRKKKRWSKEFSLSSTSVPDTSEEEYLDMAVY